MALSRSQRKLTTWPSIRHIEPLMHEVHRYGYRNSNGHLVYTVVRFEPKTFRPQMPNGTWGLTCDRILYRLPELIARVHNEYVWVCEGEKDADRLFSEGLLATTAGSATSAGKTNTGPLLEAKGVVIVPDCDDASGQFAAKLATWLFKKGKRQIQILNLDGPKGYDVSDYLNEHPINDLMQLRFTTPTWMWRPKPKPYRQPRRGGDRGRPGVPWPIEDVVHALGGQMFGGHGSAYCPAHADEGTDNKGLSLDSIDDYEDRTMVFCHSGCNFPDIADAIRKVMK